MRFLQAASAVVIFSMGTGVCPPSHAQVQPAPVTVEAQPAAHPQRVEVVRVMRAMEILAATENTTTDKLMLDPERVAEAFVTHASEHNLDPLLLVAIAWSESRFRADAKGDHLDGAPRSCGMTQVRTDFKGRPTCEALLDPDFAISWTAQYLVDTSQKGKLQLNRYNGGDYEVRIWRKVDWLKRELTALPS